MANQVIIDQHPKKRSIVAAIVRGDPRRVITARFGITNSALCRYLKDRLAVRAAKAAEERDMADGRSVLNQISEIMNRIQLLYDACHEYLKDPDNPERYELGPRAHDVEVVYYEQDEEGKRTATRKGTLQNLLAKLADSGVVVESWRYRIADPRKLIIEASGMLTKQLELIGRIYGEIKDVTVHIDRIEHWTEIKAVIMDATSDDPGMRRKIADGLARFNSD